MSPEKANALYERYPELTSGRHAGPHENLMCFGFECGDGWFDLLDRTLATLDEIRRAKLPDLRLAQVKEKFGALRIYTKGDDDDVFVKCMAAEHESTTICEECGAPGCTRDSRSWILTLCDTCATKR